MCSCRPFSDTIIERIDDSLSLSRSSSSAGGDEFTASASKEQRRKVAGANLESLSHITETEKYAVANLASRLSLSKLMTLENLTLPQLCAAAKIALNARRRERETLASTKIELDHRKVQDNHNACISPSAKQAAETLVSLMTSQSPKVPQNTHMISTCEEEFDESNKKKKNAVGSPIRSSRQGSANKYSSPRPAASR